MDNYIIIQEITRLELEKKVNEKIQKGYVPVGGVTVLLAQTRSGFYFFQAMVKK